MRNIMLSLLLFSLLAGCKSSPQTALEYSIIEYENNQWHLSEIWAKKSIKEQKNIGESQYILGLCEFKQQHLAEAQGWFLKATASPSKEVHGKATAMLGIISSTNGDYEAAEAAFAIAADELQGIDKQEATSRTSSANSTSSASSNSFTLQFGAFRDRSNANTAASDISPSLKEIGIQPVWISIETDREGKKLYLVQAGHFASRVAASTKRKYYNLPQCIVRAVE